jgi:hypothetical protein
MREIKFRRPFFKIKDNEFSHFALWGLLNYKDEFDENCFKSPSHSSHHFNKEDQQFIGLKDKNGKEIYEGDILQLMTEYGKKKKYIGKVEYVDSIFPTIDDIKPSSIACFAIICDKFDYPEQEFDNWEIIGNIYENSELL